MRTVIIAGILLRERFNAAFFKVRLKFIPKRQRRAFLRKRIANTALRALTSIAITDDERHFFQDVYFEFMEVKDD